MECPYEPGMGFLMTPFILVGMGVLGHFLERRYKRDIARYAGFLLGIGLMFPSYWFAREVLHMCGAAPINGTYVALVVAVVAWTLLRPPPR